jgi:putative ABC transport system permease protein
MRSLHRIWNRIAGSLMGHRRESDLARELESHIRMQTEDNLRLGMPAEQARREAVLKFGMVESAKEDYRDQRGLPQLDLLMQDWRYGLRQLRRTPGFTAFALLALAIGIGANATVFSVVNQVLLKPPGYRDPNRLVLFQSLNPKQETLEGYSSYDDFRDLQRQSKMLEGLSAVSPRWSFTLLGLRAAEQVQGQWVSASLFGLLGVNPILGRTFTAAEDTPGNIQGVILSYELWQRAYGGSASIVGTQIRIDNSTAPIIGVMPRGFKFLRDVDLWVPLAPNFVNQRGRGTRYLTVAGRLAAGVTIEQARSETSAIMNGFAAKYPNTNTGFSPKMTLLREFLTTDTRPVLLMLAGAVAFVLLIACANVANLTLRRTLARRQELAVRIALGAGRLRLIRQLVTESMLLSIIGGTLGLLLAAWAMYSIRLVKWKGVPAFADAKMDPLVLGFAILATLFCGLIVGLLPALRLSGSAPAIEIRGEGRSSTVSASGQRTRAGLMVCEIALTTVLLSGSGLLLRSLIRLLDVNPGFDTRDVLTFQINFSGDKYQKPQERLAFYERFAGDIRSLPGVRSVGAVSRLPLGEGNITTAFTIEGRNVPEGDLPAVDYRIASDSYFTAMGIPLISGRLADPRNPGELNITQTAGRRFWPGENAIGKRVKFGTGASQDPWRTVVGVVGDVHHLGLDIAPRPEVYRPYVANPLGGPVFAVRASGNTDTLIAAIRQRLRAMDSEIPMFNVSTMDQLLSRSLQARRFSVLLLIVFAGIALLLAGIGLYGVVSYAVGLRTHEIGIRMALGAERSSVVRMVLTQGLRVVLIGLAAGVIIALAIGPVFAPLVYGVGTRDPIALLTGAAVLLMVALTACYFPARRAAKLDPVTALRT